MRKNVRLAINLNLYHKAEMTTLFVFGLTFVSAMDYIYDLKIFNGCRDYVNMLPDKIILATDQCSKLIN